MEIFLSAVLGELITRSINFFISKCPKQPALDVDDHLQRVLLRAQVIIEEAMVRQITNQSMLQQLDMLRDTMYRGCYLLDTFRFQSHKEDAKDQIVSHPSLLFKVNSVKDFYFPGGEGTQILEEMLAVLDSLTSMILDANELVVFLTSYTRMYREPYSMHLLLGNCMFGCQMEAQHVINFLLHTRPPGAAEGLEVLPIVGPFRVGKSTLVAHVCKDGRVHDYFSEIVFLSDHDFRDENITTLREGCVMKYQNCVSNKDGRVLVVVELAGDFSEGDWKRLYSASKRYLPSGSKIIITSRSDEIKKLGTTQAITLKFLSCEAYWYYFRTLAFGSVDPETYPKLAHLAMQIARALKRTFIGANITTCVLRDNFDIRFWCKVLVLLRGIIRKNVSRFGEHPLNRLDQNRSAHLGRMATPSEDLVLCGLYQCSSQEEVPKIKMQDVMYGSVKPHGNFEVLGWKSPILPYYSYVFTCEIQELKSTAAKRKRSDP
ncbi:hypothetical protein SEVIR_2G013100v4 [Setaria viridis]|uniref:NB-ARC domain-containing protein n=1 Tax=Setaria viridis TaxID=4556 RepID=A0A4U6VQN7_SETVI|nr:disease resistance protein RGA2-like [Setaria viridis]TKW30109.1 hypothetical protein SEVIR_2G013100v2 [Setaria viridis]